MAKINTHQILADYHDRDDYPSIARYAASLAETHEAQAILEKVGVEFGTVEKIEYREQAAPLTIFGEVGTLIPENAVEQMNEVLSLPPVIKGVLLPDAHQGYTLPIGGVAVFDNSISPSCIGFDISCMVRATILNMEPDDLLKDAGFFLEALKGATSFGVGAAFDTPKDHETMHLSMWGVIPVLKRLKNKAQSQLGSSGGGNHFADLCIGTWLDTDKKFVALMTHSGSRGTGHQIATHYSKLADEYASKKLRGLKKGHGWLDMDSDLGREYFIAMSMMGMYAAANHELIHADFAKTAGVTAQEVVSNRHNYAWYAPGAGEMVHRKGATPAHAGEFGIIPGSSGSASYIVQGLGNPDSVYSSSHGAGRPFSRTQAKLQHNAVNFETHMTERGVLYAGIAPDETFMAYKDIEEVMAVQDGVLLKRVARLEPKIVLMGGKSDDGD